MKSIYATCLIILVVLSVFGSSDFSSIPKMEKPRNKMSNDEIKAFHEKRKAAIEALTPAQQIEYRAQRKAERIAYAGGMVRKTEGSGRIVYANMQSVVSCKDIEKTMNILSKYLRIRIDTQDTNAADLKDVNQYLLSHNAKAVVIVTDNQTDPAILVAPEDKWAKVNVGKFKDKNVRSRTQMELLRAFCYLCGGIGSDYRNPLTGFVGNPTQLDDSPIAELPIDVVNRFVPYLKQLGVIPYIEATYRKACREGWAPTPTNDVQKAIWDEVHAIPKNPMKIEFDPKKGR